MLCMPRGALRSPRARAHPAPPKEPLAWVPKEPELTFPAYFGLKDLTFHLDQSIFIDGAGRAVLPAGTGSSNAQLRGAVEFGAMGRMCQVTPKPTRRQPLAASSSTASRHHCAASLPAHSPCRNPLLAPQGRLAPSRLCFEYLCLLLGGWKYLGGVFGGIAVCFFCHSAPFAAVPDRRQSKHPSGKQISFKNKQVKILLNSYNSEDSVYFLRKKKKYYKSKSHFNSFSFLQLVKSM